MKKFNKFICIVLSLVMMLFVSVCGVSAESTSSVTVDGGEFVVSGHVSDYARITLLVYAPEEGGITSLCHFDGINEVNGDFSFEVPITKGTGTYSFVLAIDGESYVQETLTYDYFGERFDIKSFNKEGTVSSGGIVSGVCVLNSYQEGKVPTVATALYKTNENGTISLEDVNYSNTVSENNTIKAEVNIPNDESDYFVKIFLIDGINTLSPIVRNITVQ